MPASYSLDLAHHENLTLLHGNVHIKYTHFLSEKKKKNNAPVRWFYVQPDYVIRREYEMLYVFF
jgi:hypothetical protein